MAEGCVPVAREWQKALGLQVCTCYILLLNLLLVEACVTCALFASSLFACEPLFSLLCACLLENLSHG